MYRTLKLILFLLIPISLSGMMPDRPLSVLKPRIPDSVDGIQASFEVKAVKTKLGGNSLRICYLSANLVNKGQEAVRIRVNYTLSGKEKFQDINIEPNQQRIVLIDKYVTGKMPKSKQKSLYGQVELSCPAGSDISYSAHSSTRQ